jgi:hypothetical protein
MPYLTTKGASVLGFLFKNGGTGKYISVSEIGERAMRNSEWGNKYASDGCLNLKQLGLAEKDPNSRRGGYKLTQRGKEVMKQIKRLEGL